MKRLLEAFRGMGWERPRVAVALLPLCLFGLQYLLGALTGEPEVRLLLGALGACYLIGFVALASEWFWARWFATGLGWSGAIMGLAALVLLPVDELPPEIAKLLRIIYAIICGLHVLIIVALMGKKMAARYDMQPGWREHFGMDEFGVVRLGRAVTRASAALPGLLALALAPRQGEELLAVTAVGLAVVGLTALIRRRTWGLFAIGASAATVLTVATPAPFALGPLMSHGTVALSAASPGLSGALALLLAAAILPFATAAIRYYRSLRS